MVYAYAVEGFDLDQREAFDAILNAPAVGKQVDSPAKTRQQRAATEALMMSMSRGARG